MPNPNPAKQFCAICAIERNIHEHPTFIGDHSFVATIPDDDCQDCGCEPCQCDPIDEAEDRWEEAMMDCGMMHDGTCSKAGSEECDWDCPFSH